MPKRRHFETATRERQAWCAELRRQYVEGTLDLSINVDDPGLTRLLDDVMPEREPTEPRHS